MYELVSPPYKGGYAANRIYGVAPDGESAAFESVGAFAGAQSSETFNAYIARRSDTGWVTMPLDPPATIAPEGSVEDFSASLGLSLAAVKPGPNNGSTTFASENEFLLHPTTTTDVPENFEIAGFDLRTLEGLPWSVNYQGADADFSHILLEDKEIDALLAGGLGTSSNLYDLVTKGNGAPSLSLVEMDNSGATINPYCSPQLGSSVEKGSKFGAISASGSEVFFTVSVGTSAGITCPAGAEQLFVRLDGSRTLEVSRPLGPCGSAAASGEVPCPNAVSRADSVFQGASEDGAKVFFTTTELLSGEDSNTDNDLYLARIGCPSGEGDECEGEPSHTEVTSLIDVSLAPSSDEPADVQGVVAVAPDGSQVYFVARGVLSDGPDAEGEVPVSGADNLYVYDSVTGDQPVFVADLCSGVGLSGESRDARCPSVLHANIAGDDDVPLWAGHDVEAQTADNGRFLLFSSYGQLSDSDTDTARDVYRYDAVTGKLNRVSIGEGGYDADGNDSLFDASIPLTQITSSHVVAQTGVDSRAISEDGSRVVFTTTEPLSPNAVNGEPNLYEWVEDKMGSGEGKVSLISTGTSSDPVSEAVISPSGRDVFFVTSQGLVPQDTDGEADVYDARLNGGFPSGPIPAQPCSGDACQGPLLTPAPLLIAGSVSQASGENLVRPSVKPRAKPKPKNKDKQKIKSKKMKKTGKRPGKAKRSSTGSGKR